MVGIRHVLQPVDARDGLAVADLRVDDQVGNGFGETSSSPIECTCPYRAVSPLAMMARVRGRPKLQNRLEPAVLDPEATFRSDIERLRAGRCVSERISISGHAYDVAIGLVRTNFRV